MNQLFPRRTLEYTIKVLRPYMERTECEAIAYMILEHVFKLSRIDVIIDSPFVGTEAQHLKYEVIINRLSDYEPIQYILKQADFFGRSFYVNSNVLIPRQETESLIALIKNIKPWHRPKIADIGTGSGCIACTLYHEIPKSEVHAFDISYDALKVANKNSARLHCDIQLHELDILKQNLPEDFDVIVSNPPYVTNKERKQMKRNVLNYEPHGALFVPDEDPLLYYRTIVEECHISLKKMGMLFFEINEHYGQETLNLLYQNGFVQPQIHFDLNEKPRFVSGIKT